MVRLGATVKETESVSRARGFDVTGKIAILGLDKGSLYWVVDLYGIAGAEAGNLIRSSLRAQCDFRNCFIAADGIQATQGVRLCVELVKGNLIGPRALQSKEDGHEPVE